MTNLKNNLIYLVIGILIGSITFCSFKKDPVIPAPSTKVEYITTVKVDTITKTKFSKPIVKYVKLTDTKVEYVTIKDTTSTKINEYSTQIKKDRVEANLRVGTTGSLKYITGTFKTTDSVKVVTNTTTIVKMKPAFGIYVGPSYDVLTKQYYINSNMVLGKFNITAATSLNSPTLLVGLSYKIK